MLKRIDPNNVHRTIGYHLNITNNNTELAKTLVAKSTKYNDMIHKYHVTANQKRMAYTIFITTAIIFPFYRGTLGFEELSTIQKPLGTTICHSYNTHRSVSWACTVGPAQFGGLKEAMFTIKQMSTDWQC